MDNIGPAEFHSRKFNPAQLNYPITQKELLAIYDSMRYFDQKIRNFRFVVLTDHKPLVNFMTNMQKLQELRRWQQEMSQYDFEIQYLEGVKNTLADALSRMYNNPLHPIPSNHCV